MSEGKVAAVLFDLDGTFADTAPDLGAALNRLLREEGRAAVAADVFRPHTSAGTRGMLGIGFGLAPTDPAYPDLARRFLEHYAADICVHTCLFDGMAELVTQLERRNIAWGIVTNKPHRFTLPLMECLSYAQRAACIVSGDSAARPKPHPDPLVLACQIAKVAAQNCLYVGDDLRDIEAGRAAGMKTVAAAYGYLGTATSIDTWGADLIIQHPLELLNFV